MSQGKNQNNRKPHGNFMQREYRKSQLLSQDYDLSIETQRGSSRMVSLYLLPLIIFICLEILSLYVGFRLKSQLLMTVGTLISILAASSIKVGAHWEKGVVLRFGRFHKLAGPGLFLVFPVIDSIVYWVDQRVIATPFFAEQTLTKDTVPVDVDAVLFWMVWDPQKAALEVENYRSAVNWAAQTALRDIIGRTMLSELLGNREQIDAALQAMIDRRTEPWGVAVQAVDIRDIIIPEALQDAMSKEAQAERERKARIILSTAETEIADKFAEASRSYIDNPVALQLRSMNLLYEGLKEKGGMVVIPSASVDHAHAISTALSIQQENDIKKSGRE